MGGSALKNCETKRLQKKEYLELVDRVVRDILLNTSDEFARRVSNIRYYSSKEDFGDADILVDSHRLPSNWTDTLAALWKSKEVVKNGDCVSFEVDGFQVDVIKAKPEEYEFARSYFAYNDLGNLVGRMAKKLGLKYGHDGLFYVFRDNDQVIDTILVSRDPNAVYDLLGLDSEKPTAGFETLEDIFRFVASSKYFNPDIYLFENMNHTARVRDKKRKTYNAFLEWCRVNVAKFPPVFQFESDKSVYLPMLFGFFEQEYFRDNWMAAFHRMLEVRHNKEKFNGNMVHELTGLNGQELGAFMTHFKNRTTKDFVTISTVTTIENRIAKEFHDWKEFCAAA